MTNSRPGYLNEKQAHLNRPKRIEETVALSLLEEHLRHCTEASEAIARLVRS